MSWIFALSGALIASNGHAQTTASSELRVLVQQLQHTGRVRIAGTVVRASPTLVRIYQQSGFQPRWTDARTIADLNAAVLDVAKDGLEPAHYHASLLIGSAHDGLSPAQLDLARSDALLRMVRDLTAGKTASTPAAVDVTRLVAAKGLRYEIETLRPQHFVYRGLVAALEGLHAIEKRGGWPSLPAGTSIGRDSISERVGLLRQRLQIEGYDVGSGSEHNLYDPALEAAVRLFQHRHGLNEDGVVGASTRAALNINVATRINQLRVNLERARLIARELPDTFIAVNIAGAKVYVVAGENVLFEERAIVGKNYTRTPIFGATLQYIEVNPTWTVPPGIVNEILSLVRRDRTYLSRVGMQVVDERGRIRNPGSVSFSRYNGKTFPFHFVQAAGPENPLGRIKFVFPNRYNVYLHDTPSRQLFEQETRTFSHGCIRLRNPLKLGELILKDSPADLVTLYDALEASRTTRIALRKPIPIRILYWTASADLHGELHYYPDTYHRDAAVLAALNRGEPQ